MSSLDLAWIRNQFPALAQQINQEPIVFFDGPGGTQVPIAVIKAIEDYLIYSNANAHGVFPTSARTDEIISDARLAVSDLLGCNRDEVVFGANMTTLTFSLSRAFARQLQPGDEIILTRLDHDANFAPWSALQEQGAVVRLVDINHSDCTLNLTDLEQKINQRTRLVAVGYASNAVGTINDLAPIIQMAHSVNALVFIDAVHYLPHGPIDLKKLNCDFLACSAYKFFGPHLGILYGKHQHLEHLHPYKVRPASELVPQRWETGTQNHEALAGLVATINYLAQLGGASFPSPPNRRAALLTAMETIAQYEQELCKVLIAGLLEIPALTLYGISDPRRFQWRTPTVAIRIAGHSPRQLAQLLGQRGIFVWDGNFYALNLTERLEVESSGGLLRIGLVHYNTLEEVDRFNATLNQILSTSK